jgi:hypothetical protein
LPSSIEVVVEDDGAEVADRGFILAGVEGDLGAEVGAVDDAGVVLRAADIAGILEGDPGVAGLKEHLEHLFQRSIAGHLLARDLALASAICFVVE